MGSTNSAAAASNSSSATKCNPTSDAIVSGSAQRHVGIIGAGPAGLAALKTVLDTPEFAAGLWAPVVLEARDDVGGIWLPAPSSFPSISPSGEGSTCFPSPPATPLYDSLTTNLAHPAMAFSSFAFPPSTPLFPIASVVQRYLSAYADNFGLRPYLKLGTRVVGVHWAAENGSWEVMTETATPSNDGATTTTTTITTYNFDLLLVCTGHYTTPQYPSEYAMPGLGAWLAARRAFHSVFYRNPSSIPVPLGEKGRSMAYSGLARATILVVGSGPSGTDIAAELVQVTGRVMLSSSSYAAPGSPSSPGVASSSSTEIVYKPPPTIFHVEASTSTPTGRVTFTDSSEEDVDFCVLATGYEVDFPFFDQRPFSSPVTATSIATSSPCSPNPDSNHTEDSPSSTAPNFALPRPVLPHPLSSHSDTRGLTNSNWSVFPLAQHLFPLPGFFQPAVATHVDAAAPHPTSLAFLGLPVRVAPFPLVEAQARAALRAWTFCDHSQPTEGDSRRELDWDDEERAIKERWEVFAHQWDASASASSGSRFSVSGDASASEKEIERRAFIAKNWHRLPDAEQFEYRDALDAFAANLPPLHQGQGQDAPGAKVHGVRAWEPRIYEQMGPLRAAWRALEARGDGSAERWVSGVGEGQTPRGGGGTMEPEEEWVAMMDRLLVWWDKEQDGRMKVDF